MVVRKAFLPHMRKWAMANVMKQSSNRKCQAILRRQTETFGEAVFWFWLSIKEGGCDSPGNVKTTEGVRKSSRLKARVDQRPEAVLTYLTHSLYFRGSKELPDILAIVFIFNFYKVVDYVPEDVVFPANWRPMKW
jgi:hypothetical protein